VRRTNFASMRVGETLVLVGATVGDLGASLYLRELLGREDGAPPPVDLTAERRNGDFVRALIGDGAVSAVHDLSDGGLVAAAAEMAMASNQGISLRLPDTDAAVAMLFGEDQARYLLAAKDVAPILAAAAAAGVPAVAIGAAEGEALSVDGLFSLPLARLREAHETWLPGYMESAV
ncbi:MAG TPA: AIR synthase-related protein, partial [Caulobacteraceae bacterium]|nr:AIR synthase-related protein [Caulobacteraceae bacterium]